MFVLLQVWFVMVDPYCFPAFCPCSIVFAGYPWLKPSDMIRALHRWNQLGYILPESTLEASKQHLAIYWDRFRKLYPDHEIFDILTNDQLQLTLPVKIHGDEGRRPLYFAKVIVLFVCLFGFLEV